MALSETCVNNAVDVDNLDLSSTKKEIISAYESICINESKVVDVGSKTVFNGKVTINHIVCPVSGVENCEMTRTVDPMCKRSSREKLLSETDSQQETIRWWKLFWIILCITLLCAVLVVLGVVFSLGIQIQSWNTNKGHSSDKRIVFVNRTEWQAREPTGTLKKLRLPVGEIIIAHTNTQMCYEQQSCIQSVKSIQNYHLDEQHYSDIAYQFLVGGNGFVFIGRGWNNAGAHTKSHNFKSISIAFIGKFSNQIPTNKQISAVKLLIEVGLNLHKISTNFTIYSQCQLTSSESPGKSLHNIVSSWQHFDTNNSLTCVFKETS